MSRKHPSQVGRCSRWLPLQMRTCGRSARFEVYGGLQRLCKECHARFKAGKETLFDAGIPPTAARRWELQKRLADTVPAR